MANQERKQAAAKPHGTEEPKRTPGQAEGTEAQAPPSGNPDQRGPHSADRHPRTQQEPGRTPGKAEG